MVQHILQAPGSSVEIARLMPPDNFTPLHLAATSGQVHVAEVSMPCQQAPAPFHASECLQSPEALLQALIRARADIEAIGSNATTPLHLSVQAGHIAVVETLVQAGCKIDHRDGDGDTALHIAAYGIDGRGHPEVSAPLIMRHGSCLLY